MRSHGSILNLAGIVSALALAGCSVATPPHVAAPLPFAQKPTAVRLDAATAMQSPEGTRFVEALKASLTRHQIALSDDAATVLTVALSQRRADMGTSQAASADWLLPRKHRLFDACHARRMVAVLVARQESAADPEFTARGGFDYCKLDPAALDGLAEALAAKVAGG